MKNPRIKKIFFIKNLKFFIAAFIIIILVIALSLSDTLKKNDQKNQDNSNSNQSPKDYHYVYNPGNYTYKPQNYTYQPQNYTSPQPLVTASILQSILQKSPEINKLPNDAKIVLEFHDNTKEFCGYIFFISGKGNVYAYAKQAYDLWLTLNINEIPALQSSTNVCADLKSMVKNGQAWIIYTTSNPFALLKYLSIKSCVM
jgi:hypothetical protein